MISKKVELHVTLFVFFYWCETVNYNKFSFAIFFLGGGGQREERVKLMRREIWLLKNNL